VGEGGIVQGEMSYPIWEGERSSGGVVRGGVVRGEVVQGGNVLHPTAYKLYTSCRLVVKLMTLNQNKQLWHRAVSQRQLGIFALYRII